MRFLLMVLAVLALPSCSKPQDPPAAKSGSVLFFGDSITRECIKLENGLTGNYASVNWGVGGLGTYFGFRMAANVTRDNAACRVAVIAFGTNDAYGGRVSVSDFERDLGLIVDIALSRDMLVVLPSIPFSPLAELAGLPSYNAAISRIIGAKGCFAGPDFYKLFSDHPEYIQSDLTHPTHDGYVAMNELYAAGLADMVK